MTTAPKPYPRPPKPGTRHYLLRNLADATRATLKADADRLGQPLQEYLRRLLDAKAAELDKGHAAR